MKLGSQTHVTPLREDELGNITITTKAVEKILEEQANDISDIEYNDDISNDEYDLLVSGTSQDTSEAASEIVRLIMEELKLEADGTPKSGSFKPGKTSCWRRSIFSFVAKLRSRLCVFCLVDTFIKLMCNWLNQQAQQHEGKRNLVSLALRQIEEVVVSLPALTKAPYDTCV